MATTQLKDIFSEEYYLAIEPQNSPEKTAVYQSGIIRHSEALDNIASNGQGTADVYYWNDLDADESPNVTTDNPDQIGKVGKVTQSSLRARTLYLNKGYGVMDLTAELATSSPIQHIRNRFGTYWERQWQRYLVSASKGIIQSNIANNNSDMVIDLGGKVIGASAVQDAAYTAGDSADMFTGMAVHSGVMRQMIGADMIEYIKDSDGRILLATYLGRPVFMDDSLHDGKGNYISVMYGDGAFGYGVGQPHVPVELERKASGGNGGGAETIWERKTYILTPAGFSWDGEGDPNKTPGFDDYANPVNWRRAFERKNVPFAAVLSGNTPNATGGTGDMVLGD